MDALSDSAGGVLIAGIMEHIEEAGVHSGDSSCVLPPFSIGERQLAVIRDYTERLARALNVTVAAHRSSFICWPLLVRAR